MLPLCLQHSYVIVGWFLNREVLVLVCLHGGQVILIQDLKVTL